MADRKQPAAVPLTIFHPIPFAVCHIFYTFPLRFRNAFRRCQRGSSRHVLRRVDAMCCGTLFT